MSRSSRVVENLTEVLEDNGLAIVSTDTIYGITALAWSKKAVGRTYRITKRDSKKPFIILISSVDDLNKFNIKLDKHTQNILKKIWPGKVSVILPVTSKKFRYLHCGTKTLAFRLPKKKSLIKLLKKTGPLISSSANPQGLKPAETIAQAKKYFGDNIDFYIDSGKIKSQPSTLIEIKNGQVRVIRKGAEKINSLAR
jgi:L-threonylcarbamoyladenylate synthase